MINRFSAVILSAAISLGTAATASADDLKIHTFDEGAIYTKPFTNLKGGWFQETGVTAPLLTDGPWLFKYNIAYIQQYPLKFKVGPQWTSGATVVYEFNKHEKIVPGIYTKAKNNLQGLWQEETGFTARTRMGRYGLVLNAGYLFNYPRQSDAKPLWQIGLSFLSFFK